MTGVNTMLETTSTGDATLTATQSVISIRCRGTQTGWSYVQPETIEGKLALHKSILCFNGQEPVLAQTCYTVTHLPTGCVIDERIEGKDRAEQYLHALKGLNWDFTAKEACVPLSEQVFALRRSILGR